MFDDKVLLTTWGTGSFGNALLRRILQTNVREVQVFSCDEKVQDNLRRLFRNRKIRYYIGNVCVLRRGRQCQPQCHTCSMRRRSSRSRPANSIRSERS